MNPCPAPLLITGVLQDCLLGLPGDRSDARRHLFLDGLISRDVIQARHDIIRSHGIEALSTLEFGDCLDRAGSQPERSSERSLEFRIHAAGLRRCKVCRMNADLQTPTPHPGASRFGEEFGVPH